MATEPIINNNPIGPLPVAPPQIAESLRSRLHKHLQFASRYVDDKHDFVVYTPPQYESEPQRRYPVLFMQDGQNLFDPETSFIKGEYWRMGETADALIASGEIGPLIIVGIYNTGVNRVDEYTPTEDRRLGGGQADEYGRMLVTELKPFVETQYRTLIGPGDCGVGGSSLGGLVSLYLGLHYPDVFSKLAVLSPSVWWHRRAIVKTVAGLRHKPALRIWLDVGTQESLRALPDAVDLKEALVRKGWHLGHDLSFLKVEGAHHNEAAWSLRVAPMLRFLFSDH